MAWQDRGYPLYLMFQIYQKVLFMDPGAVYPATKERVGYNWLGVCKHCGDQLTFWILVDDTVQVITRSCGATCYRQGSQKPAY